MKLPLALSLETLKVSSGMLAMGEYLQTITHHETPRKPLEMGRNIIETTIRRP